MRNNSVPTADPRNAQYIHTNRQAEKECLERGQHIRIMIPLRATYPFHRLYALFQPGEYNEIFYPPITHVGITTSSFSPHLFSRRAPRPPLSIPLRSNILFKTSQVCQSLRVRRPRALRITT